MNSAEMDLRDLEKLTGSSSAPATHALTDLEWVRLRPMQDLIARFFDDETALRASQSSSA